MCPSPRPRYVANGDAFAPSVRVIEKFARKERRFFFSEDPYNRPAAAGRKLISGLS
jgi:hypothetical protein